MVDGVIFKDRLTVSNDSTCCVKAIDAQKQEEE